MILNGTAASERVSVCSLPLPPRLDAQLPGRVLCVQPQFNSFKISKINIDNLRYPTRLLQL